MFACHVTREVFGVGVGIIPYTCMGLVGKYHSGSRTLNRVSFFYLVGFVSLVLSLDRVTQVVMDGLVYYPFHFVEKLIILNTLGRLARSYELCAGKENFLIIPMVFALEGSLEKKNVLRWNDTPFKCLLITARLCLLCVDTVL